MSVGGPNGPQVERLRWQTGRGCRRGKRAHLDDGPDGRYWSVSVPRQRHQEQQGPGSPCEASLDQADALAPKYSLVFWAVTLCGAMVLMLVAQLLVSRLIMPPITRMTEAMGKVEGGQLDVEVPLGNGREFDLLARGFNLMLSRVVEQRTADLAKRNHDLAELNDLLVAARRDLTAKERLAALGQLAGTIAHELGNPLNSISGHVQLLERNEALPDGVRADLATVSGEVRRMTDVIRRFLDSTRGLRPAPEEVDLDALVTEALDMSLSAEARARLSVSRLVSPELSAKNPLAGVVTDPSLVRHVLTNLIANAVDAMPAGGALEVRAFIGDGELRLSVKDSGTGITAEDRRRIFEPFYTTKSRGKGTGLGLAICREIARALKGRIDVETELGKGSTFTLAVPLQRTSPGSRAPEPASPPVDRRGQLSRAHANRTSWWSTTTAPRAS